MQDLICKITDARSHITLYLEKMNLLFLASNRVDIYCIVNTILKYWNENCIYQDILMKYVKAFTLQI